MKQPIFSPGEFVVVDNSIAPKVGKVESTVSTNGAVVVTFPSGIYHVFDENSPLLRKAGPDDKVYFEGKLGTILEDLKAWLGNR